MTARVAEAVRQAADAACCDPSDFEGMTLGEVFHAVEEGNVRIYWGFWTDLELDTIIG